MSSIFKVTSVPQTSFSLPSSFVNALRGIGDYTRTIGFKNYKKEIKTNLTTVYIDSSLKFEVFLQGSSSSSFPFIQGDFSNPKIQKAICEILDLYGKGIKTVYFMNNTHVFGIDFLRYLPDLEKVDVDIECNGLVDIDFFETIGRMYPSIKKIYVGSDDILTEDILRDISKISHLEKLELYWLYDFTQKGFEELFSSLPNLKHLSFVFSSVTCENLLFIFKNCKNLETLTLRVCTKLSEEIVQILKTMCSVQIDYPFRIKK